MEKKIYCKPNSKVVDVLVSELMATSGGDANGSLDNMPWGGNQKHEGDFPWSDVEDVEDEF